MEEKLKEFYCWLQITHEEDYGSPEAQSAVQQVIYKFEELGLDQ